MGKRQLGLFVLLLILSSCGPSGSETADNTMNSPEHRTANEAPRIRSGPVAFCDVVKRRISVADCEDLRAIRAEITRGGAALNAPDPMRRGKTVEVTLIVDRRPRELIEQIDAMRTSDSRADALENQAEAAEDPGNTVEVGNMAEDAGGNGNMRRGDNAASNSIDTSSPTPTAIVSEMEGTPQAFAPKVGRFMSADLIGHGFEIKSLTPRSQEIPDEGQATWSWEVTARKEGRLTLTARTIVEGEVEGERYPLGDTQTSKTVLVEVTGWDRWWDFIDQLPGWLKKLTAVLTALAALIAGWFAVRAALRKGKAPS